MPPFIALPKYQASPLLDLSPVAQGIAQRDRALEAEARRAMQERQFAEQQRQFNIGSQRADQQLALSQAADARAAEMAPLQRQLVQAQAEEARRKAAMGGEQPSNVREWQYFNRLSPAEKQQYLTMKRAEKYLDLGTHFARPNSIDSSQPPVATFQKDIEGKEHAEARGQASGKAAADLPRILDNAAQALQTIEQIRVHPGRRVGTGVAGIIPPIPGTEQAGFVDLVEQAKGKAFLEAFNSLKGGGQITEAEGRKATEAIARLNRARRPEDFEAALKDFEDVIRAGVARAQRSAAPPQRTPAAGGWSVRKLD